MGFISETQEDYHGGSNIGGYQYVPLADIVNNFILMFTGEGKVIPKARKTEIQMHAKRCIQEFSYDVFKSYKAQEIELPPSLTMQLPQDYVNWVKVTWVDSQGLERELHPVRITSNPSSILQDSNYAYTFDGEGALALANNSVAWSRTKESGTNDNRDTSATDNVDTFDAALRGERFGLDPEHANSNGGFYIDRLTGLMHFTGAVNGAIVVLHYISDCMGTDAEQVVHKFAEDAVYKYMLYSIIAVTNGSQEYLVRRYKKSYVAAKRLAKLRLSNLKIGSITQMARGKSKQIKH